MPTAKRNAKCFAKMDGVIVVSSLDGKNVLSRHDFQEFMLIENKKDFVVFISMYVKNGELFEKIGYVRLDELDAWEDVGRGIKFDSLDRFTLKQVFEFIKKSYLLSVKETDGVTFYATSGIGTCILPSADKLDTTQNG